MNGLLELIARKNNLCLHTNPFGSLVKLAVAFSLAMTIIIIFVPSLKLEDSNEEKFELYQDDYFAISDAIFQAYDEGKISIGDQFNLPAYNTYYSDKLKPTFPDEVIEKMGILSQSAGVSQYIVADEDVVYFSFGAFFQSVSGIAICRNDKDPSTDDSLKSRFFDGSPSYRYITDCAYHFSDGL